MIKLDRSSITKTNKTSDKFRLVCAPGVTGTTEDWLIVKNYLREKEFNVLLGQLNNYKHIVVKFGEPKNMLKEYNVGILAHQNKVPNFMKYLCNFTCNDNVSNIQKQDFQIRPYLCDGHGDALGIIVMPFYELGNLLSFCWTRENFDVLKNVLKQVVHSTLYAYEKFDFYHTDLHLENILIRKTKKKYIEYGSYCLETMGLYAIIMDFERSEMKPDQVREVYRSLERVFALVEHMDGSKIAIDVPDRNKIKELGTNKTPITSEVYRQILDVIDTIYVRYDRQ